MSDIVKLDITLFSNGRILRRKGHRVWAVIVYKEGKEVIRSYNMSKKAAIKSYRRSQNVKKPENPQAF